MRSNNKREQPGRDKEGKEIDEDQYLVAKFFRGQQSFLNWIINSRMKNKQQIQSFFFQLKRSSNVRTIKVEWNQIPNMLTLASIPQFSALKSLNVGANNIHSLEAIISLKASNLTELFVYTNKITDIRSLRKANLPRLRLIDLSRNRVCELGKLYQVGSQNLNFINMDCNLLTNLNQVYKMSFFTKNGTLLVCLNPIISPSLRNAQKSVFRFRNSIIQGLT